MDVYFLTCLRVFFARALYLQNVQGWTGFKTEAMFLRCKNSRPEVYTDVHFRTGYFQKRWKGKSCKVVYIW